MSGPIREATSACDAFGKYAWGLRSGQEGMERGIRAQRVEAPRWWLCAWVRWKGKERGSKRTSLEASPRFLVCPRSSSAWRTVAGGQETQMTLENAA